MPLCSTNFDDSLSIHPGLTWLPWVGENYSNLARDQRCLIVGESHYSNEKDAAKSDAVKQRLLGAQSYTREVVSECCIHKQWPNRTLASLHRVLFLTTHLNRHLVWADLSYYNFIQRPMWFPTGFPERPTAEDFLKGWSVFLKVIETLQPSHCLFIGLSAANFFNAAMLNQKASHQPITWTEKVGRTHARAGQVEIHGHSTSIHFIQHTGKFFSWRSWNHYLNRQAPGLMACIRNPAFLTTAPAAA